jgi:hypothetical protein
VFGARFSNFRGEGSKTRLVFDFSCELMSDTLVSCFIFNFRGEGIKSRLVFDRLLEFISNTLVSGSIFQLSRRGLEI